MSFAVYSLLDTRVVLNHPDTGRCVLSDSGGGRVTISHAADLSSHTATARGSVIVNRMKARHGSVALELPQNSAADLFMRRWTSYLESAAPSVFASSTLTILDEAAGRTWVMTGVTPQKWPDVTYDQNTGSVTWTLLAAEIREK